LQTEAPAAVAVAVADHPEVASSSPSLQDGQRAQRGHGGTPLRCFRAYRPLSVWGVCAAALFVGAVVAAVAFVGAEAARLQVSGATANATVQTVGYGNDNPWGDVSSETSKPQATVTIDLPDDIKLGDRRRVFIVLVLVLGYWSGRWAMHHWFDAKPSNRKGASRPGGAARRDAHRRP
jgi:hypothetical protein